jgi:hypothetical protein
VLDVSASTAFAVDLTLIAVDNIADVDSLTEANLMASALSFDIRSFFAHSVFGE